MSFRRYDHVERFGTDEVEGIEIGDVLIFPKLDGTNASIWWHDGRIRAGSRNRELSLENDNAGFFAAVSRWENVPKFLETKRPNWILYGEWLVPHTIKNYRDEAWQKFWIFDVYCREKKRYVHYDEYGPFLLEHHFDVIEPKCRYLSPPSYEQLLREVAVNDYLMKDGHVGEGIVIKNYDWTNKYGHQPWAKLVRNEFKEENKRAFGTTEKIGEWQVEAAIAEKYCTKAFVDKTLAKITNDMGLTQERLKILEDKGLYGFLDSERRVIIPRLLQTCFHDLVTEEIWHAIREHKNPTIDFKKLNQYTVYWIKKHVPELF